MNLLALAVAALAFSAVNDGSSRTSATIHYRTVDRSGNVLTLSLGSGHPYYGREAFYYKNRRYSRYGRPHTVFLQPVFLVHRPHYDPYHACSHFDPYYDPYYEDVYYDDGYYGDDYDDGYYYEDDYDYGDGYYGDPYYARYEPCYSWIDEPVYYSRPVVYVNDWDDDRAYWKYRTEQDKRWAKAYRDANKRWAKSDRDYGRMACYQQRNPLVWSSGSRRSDDGVIFRSDDRVLLASTSPQLSFDRSFATRERRSDSPQVKVSAKPVRKAESQLLAKPRQDARTKVDRPQTRTVNKQRPESRAKVDRPQTRTVNKQRPETRTKVDRPQTRTVTKQRPETRTKIDRPQTRTVTKQRPETRTKIDRPQTRTVTKQRPESRTKVDRPQTRTVNKQRPETRTKVDRPQTRTATKPRTEQRSKVDRPTTQKQGGAPGPRSGGSDKSRTKKGRD